MSEIHQIKKDIVKACKWLKEKELVIGTWGNVSVRYKQKIILTPSRVNYDIMTPNDIVIINLKGAKIEGHNIPTSERDIHRLIYLNREDVGAVVHSHSTFATALSCAGKTIPVLIEEMSQLLGGEVPCTSKYVPAGHHMELAEETIKSIKNKNAILLRNHGVVCCGKNLEEALLACLVVEKAAKIYINLYGMSELKTIPDNLVKEERNRYIFKYGKEEQ